MSIIYISKNSRYHSFKCLRVLCSVNMPLSIEINVRLVILSLN